MPTYTFTFKKDEFSVEYVTDDRESMERQFQIWVTCASVYTYNKEKIEKGLVAEPLPKAEKTPKPVEEQPKSEVASIVIEKNEVEKESERIIREYKAEMEAEQRRKEKEELKKEFKTEVENVVAKEEAITEELKELYSGKTINSIMDTEKNKESQEITIQDKHDFDAILENTLSATVSEPSKKDERFLKVLKVKNITEKIDYLIVTAYYLSEFEKADRFTLKQVNAKLMENVSEFIDHSVMQEAIDKGLVEAIPNFTGITAATEYRLTEAGEEAFLNGSVQ